MKLTEDCDITVHWVENVPYKDMEGDLDSLLRYFTMSSPSFTRQKNKELFYLFFKKANPRRLGKSKIKRDKNSKDKKWKCSEYLV